MKPRTVEEWRVVLDLIDAFLKRLREADSDERLRMLEEGKQPRPAAEAKCERCGGTKRVYDLGAEQWPDACPNCSPAAHTAQVTEEVMEDLPSRPPNKVADLLTLWSKEYLDDRGMVFASSLCDDAAAYLRHYATLRRHTEHGYWEGYERR